MVVSWHLKQFKVASMVSEEDFIEAFESPDYLLTASKRKFQDFVNILSKELRSLQVEWVHDQEMFQGFVVHRMSVHGRPTIQLREQAYAVVVDLRNALDQAVFNSSLLLYPLMDKQKKKKTYFPFADNAERFEELFKPKGGSSDLAREITDLLRSKQPWPYDHQTSTGDTVFWSLGKLSGPNKHQVIIELGPELSGQGGNTSADGFVYEQFIPPRRSDLLGFATALPRVRNRTDFISAITPPGTTINFDGWTEFAFTAKEARNIQMPIDDLLDTYIIKASQVVADIKQKTSDLLDMAQGHA